MTGIKFEHDNYTKYDLREPPRKIIHPDKIKTQKIDHITDDWSNIPFYPTTEKRREMIQQYGENMTNEIISYSYENSTDPTKEVIPPYNQKQMHQMFLDRIKQYNEFIKYQNSKQHNISSSNINNYTKIARKASKSANIRLGGVY